MRKIFNFTVKPLLVLSLLVGVGMFNPGEVSADDAFKAAWDAAEASRQEAATLGYEWRDTKSILGKAKSAADEGNLENAMNLVARAQEESGDAIAQQAREAGLWKARVPQ